MLIHFPTNSKIKMLEERISSLESITAGSIDLSDIKTRLVNLEVTDADQYQQQQEIDQLLRETNKSLEEIVNN